jgi:hypothetical protein
MGLITVLQLYMRVEHGLKSITNKIKSNARINIMFFPQKFHECFKRSDKTYSD